MMRKIVVATVIGLCLAGCSPRTRAVPAGGIAVSATAAALGVRTCALATADGSILYTQRGEPALTPC